MSKDIIVLTPNGRRQKVHCTPDTSILQILEDVCHKQGFQPSDYNLKHHSHVLDLTTTIRFSNLPNKAMLEMVETDQRREESNVTIGLQLEDEDRRTADFPPHTSLYDIITSLASKELGLIKNPTILYMRQEVVGQSELQTKTLRQLGLIGGRAILRLLDKQEETRQANVSSVYRRPASDIKVKDTKNESEIDKPKPEHQVPGPSEIHKSVQDEYHVPDIITKFKEDTIQQKNCTENKICEDGESSNQKKINQDSPMEEESAEIKTEEKNSISSFSSESREYLERRLKIEDEVVFLGEQKAVVFMQPEHKEQEIEDLPDDFYELSIEEVRRLYHDLQQHRIDLENTPLITSNKRDENEKQVTQHKLKVYKHVVVRVQFPDHIILQGIFLPTNTIEDVNHFVKLYLRNPHEDFHIFTTPLKESLEPSMTLLDAKFVPCVHMHFKWLKDDTSKQPYLKDEIYKKQTASDAASILASKYRAPTRRKQEDGVSSYKPSTSKSSKLPKWFKK